MLYVPGFVNVWRHVASRPNCGDVKEPSVAVTVWTSGSLFFHCTVLPVSISMRDGT